MELSQKEINILCKALAFYKNRFHFSFQEEDEIRELSRKLFAEKKLPYNKMKSPIRNSIENICKAEGIWCYVDPTSPKKEKYRMKLDMTSLFKLTEEMKEEIEKLPHVLECKVKKSSLRVYFDCKPSEIKI